MVCVGGGGGGEGCQCVSCAPHRKVKCEGIFSPTMFWCGVFESVYFFYIFTYILTIFVCFLLFLYNPVECFKSLNDANVL